MTDDKDSTLHAALYDMFRRMRSSHLVADDLAERAADVASAWYAKNGGATS